jgi:hypothetical protein
MGVVEAAYLFGLMSGVILGMAALGWFPRG